MAPLHPGSGEPDPHGGLATLTDGLPFLARGPPIIQCAPSVAVRPHPGRSVTGSSHDLAAVERPAPASPRTRAARLQRSHDLAAVESPARPCFLRLSGIASTEPRPRGRGERPRMVVSPKLSWVLQRSHDLAAVERPERLATVAAKVCFNGATTSRPWRASSATAWCRRGPRFNGATTSRPWVLVTVVVGLLASTEPRPRGRGEDRLLCADVARREASTEPRPRGRGESPGSTL